MIELLLLDVDGTLTDGKIYYGEDGGESKAFSIKDGLGLNLWHKIGRKSAIITGRKSQVVERRARELGVSWVFMGVENKGKIARELAEKLGITKQEIASIGDDLNDLSMFVESALCFIPSDASTLLHPYANHILKTRGGEGAVREMIEKILLLEGLEESWLGFYL